MSKSKRNPSFSKHKAKSYHEWRKSEHRRYRRKCRITIVKTEHLEDTPIFASFKKFSNLWNSPLDGRLGYNCKPHQNKCVQDFNRGWYQFGKSKKWVNLYGELINGHHTRCGCLINPSGWYAKESRK